jgi:hypothetical protein
VQTQNKHDKFLEDLDVKAILGQDLEANIDSDLPMRKWLYSWLLDPNIPGNFQKNLDKWISYLIIINLFTLIFENVPAVFEPYQFWFQCFDIFSVGVFTIESLCACTWHLKTKSLSIAKMHA